MLTATLAALACPQGEGKGMRTVGVDENGWPIFESPAEGDPGSGRGPAVAPGTLAETPPAAPLSEAPRPESPAVVLRQPLAIDSPLRDVFSRIGQPADLEDLGGVIAWYRFVLRDHRGAELAAREVTHEADFAVDRRDRLLLPGRKVYGRDGSAVWAELHRLPMPTYEAEAAEELELFGLLLRAPWVFGDETRFRVGAIEYETRGRERFERVVIHRIVAGGERSDRFELLCDPHTHDPRELRFELASGSGPRRLLLGDYRRVGGVRIPLRRAVVDGRGQTLVEWTIARVDAHHSFPAQQFRPVLR